MLLSRVTGVGDEIAPSIDDIKGGRCDISVSVDRPYCAIRRGCFDVHCRSVGPEDIRQDFPALVRVLRIGKWRSTLVILHHVMAIRQNLKAGLSTIPLS